MGVRVFAQLEVDQRGRSCLVLFYGTVLGIAGGLFIILWHSGAMCDVHVRSVSDLFKSNIQLLDQLPFNLY